MRCFIPFSKLYTLADGLINGILVVLVKALQAHQNHPFNCSVSTVVSTTRHRTTSR